MLLSMPGYKVRMGLKILDVKLSFDIHNAMTGSRRIKQSYNSGLIES